MTKSWSVPVPVSRSPLWTRVVSTCGQLLLSGRITALVAQKQSMSALLKDERAKTEDPIDLAVSRPRYGL
jgi:hypothetical protein